MKRLIAEPLTAQAFLPYGTVIEAGNGAVPINEGTTEKFSDLAQVQLDPGASASMHIYRPTPITLPSALRLLERHPLASQAFIPLEPARFAVVVATATPKANSLRAFVTSGRQGIQFDTGVWHHPFLALDQADFLIIDRYCEDQVVSKRNLETVNIEAWSVDIVESRGD